MLHTSNSTEIFCPVDVLLEQMKLHDALHGREPTTLKTSMLDEASCAHHYKLINSKFIVAALNSNRAQEKPTPRSWKLNVVMKISKVQPILYRDNSKSQILEQKKKKKLLHVSPLCVKSACFRWLSMVN